MAPHSTTLAWQIPWTEEPGRLQSMRSLEVRHDWATSLSLFTFMHWRRKWQPTPVFLPGESQGWRSLVGCRLWGRTELDTTEATKQQQQQQLISRESYGSITNNLGDYCCSVAQLCPTLCDPMNCSLPGSSVHGILQARILQWVALTSSRGSSRP